MGLFPGPPIFFSLRQNRASFMQATISPFTQRKRPWVESEILLESEDIDEDYEESEEDAPEEETHPDPWDPARELAFDTFAEFRVFLLATELPDAVVFAGKNAQPYAYWLRPGMEDVSCAIRVLSFLNLAVGFHEAPFTVFHRDDTEGTVFHQKKVKFPDIPVRSVPKAPFCKEGVYAAFAGEPHDTVIPLNGRNPWQKPIRLNDQEMYGAPSSHHDEGRVGYLADYLGLHFFSINVGSGDYYYRYADSDMRRLRGTQGHFITLTALRRLLPLNLQRMVKGGPDDGKVVKYPRAEILEDHASRNNINDIVFDPRQPNPAQLVDPMTRNLNTFKGTTKDQSGFDKASRDAIRKCSPIHWLVHLYVVRCGCDLRTFLLLLVYLTANAVDPSRKIPVTIIFAGSQAIMKTQEMRMLDTEIPRENRKKVKAGQISDLFGQATSDIYDAMSITMDEGGVLTHKQAAGLKELLTSSEARERKLYSNPRTVASNIARFIVTCELDKLKMGSNTLFGRRDFQCNGWGFWKDRKFKPSPGVPKDWYINFWFNYMNTGDVSAEPVTKETRTDFELMRETDVLKHPGILSAYWFRQACDSGPVFDLQSISPSNRETMKKQILLAEKDGDGQALLFNVLENQTLLGEDSKGVEESSWDFSEDGRTMRKLKICITQTIIKEWADALDAFWDMLKNYPIIAEILEECGWTFAVEDMLLLCPVSLRTQLTERLWPGPNTVHYPRPVAEGDEVDSYGRDPDALVHMRKLWDINQVSSPESRKRYTLLNEKLGQDYLSIYSKTVGYLQYVDQEMSVPFDYKSYIVPECVWLAAHQMKEGRMKKNWDFLISPDTYKDLAEVYVTDDDGNDLALFSDKIKALIMQGAFRRHVWRMKARVRVYKTSRLEGQGMGESGKKVLLIIPSFARLRRMFVDSRVPGENCYTVFAPNCLFSGTADELAYCTSLRDLLSPWVVAKVTACLLLEGSYKDFNDLVRKVFFYTLYDGVPDMREELSYERFLGEEGAWRERWELYDSAGVDGDGRAICPFEMAPNKFALVPKLALRLDEWEGEE